MATPTLQDLFGANVTKDTTAGTLTITFSDFQTNEGLDSISDPSPESIASALVKKWNNAQPDNADDDPDWGVVIGSVFKSFVTRDTSDQISYDYSVTFYATDTTATLDPDDVV